VDGGSISTLAVRVGRVTACAQANGCLPRGVCRAIVAATPVLVCGVSSNRTTVTFARHACAVLDCIHKMIFPAEITGTESTRVACKGTVVRLELTAQTRTGVAATIDSYEFR
jgi:hypothetical protein